LVRQTLFRSGFLDLRGKPGGISTGTSHRVFTPNTMAISKDPKTQKEIHLINQK
jgi:hypothetical protein